MEELYFDNATAAAPSGEAIEAMRPFLQERWGTPAAPCYRGQDLIPAMEAAFASTYQLLGASPDSHQFFALSSGAEAVNHVFNAVYYDVTRASGKNHFIVGCNDEAAAILAASQLEQIGCSSTFAEVNTRGELSAESIADALTPRTALVSLSWANGLTGVVQPVEEIAALCRERGVLLHLDATHVLGKLYFDLSDSEPDFITFHGEPLYLPPGIGGLFVKGKRRVTPLILGRPENVPMLVALGQVAKELMQQREHVGMELARLRDHFERRLTNDIPGTEIFHRDAMRLPTTSAFGFRGVHNEALLYLLNERKVVGSFGGGHFQRLALQLQAAGMEAALTQSAVSFTLSRSSTQEQVDSAADLIGEIVRSLRPVSEHLFQELTS